MSTSRPTLMLAFPITEEFVSQMEKEVSIHEKVKPIMDQIQREMLDEKLADFRFRKDHPYCAKILDYKYAILVSILCIALITYISVTYINFKPT